MSFINTTSTARPVVIGIDHGFGNIKTAHSCFKTGVTAYNREPTFSICVIPTWAGFRTALFLMGTVQQEVAAKHLDFATTSGFFRTETVHYSYQRRAS